MEEDVLTLPPDLDEILGAPPQTALKRPAGQPAILSVSTVPPTEPPPPPR